MAIKTLSKLAILLVFLVLGTLAEEAVLTLESPSELSPSQVIFECDDQEASLQVQADSSFDLKRNDKRILHYNDSADTLSTEYDLELGHTLAIKEGADSLTFQGIKQWKLWVENDFQEASSREGWSKDQFSTCGESPNIFMGGHCNFADDELEKTFKHLPAHDKIKITFNMHFFDEWKGETAYAKADNQYIWTEKYSWCEGILPFHCKQVGINVCGEDIPDRMSRTAEIVLKHTESSVKLTFGSTLKGDPCLASWGLDDVRIYIA